jgi:5'-nucleotidase
MKHALKLVLAGVAMVGVGCSNNKKPAVNSSAMDIRSSSPAPAPAPVVVQPAQPVQPVQPVVADTPPVAANPAVASATPTITGNAYTIQKGDTLFKIARAKYGDPSAVNKIKAANPGLDANHIKVGQRIKLP